ncbi:MAG: TetR/AcrR family transcriptional regulator [Candidatus Limnocylindrales bacterium]
MKQSQPARGVGRPRSTEADRAVLDAAITLLAERGYQSMTMEAVAEAAKVGKPTVYRRYRSKAELVAAALLEMSPAEAPALPEGSREAVLVLLRTTARALANPGAMTIMGSLLAEVSREPELLRALRDRVFGPHRVMVGSVLRSGVESGEIAADADLEIVDTLLFGALLARSILGEPVTDSWLKGLVDSIWKGMDPR